VSKKEICREFYCIIFYLKKSAAEAYRIFIHTYGDCALSETIFTDWFRHSKNYDFDVEDKERSGALKKFEDEELKAFMKVHVCR